MLTSRSLKCTAFVLLSVNVHLSNETKCQNQKLSKLYWLLFLLFVIQGGDPSINWSQMLLEPAQKLKDAGVNVFAVGTTPIATVDELKAITSASADQSRVIPLQGYSQLQGVVPQIAKKACQIAGKCFKSNSPLTFFNT